MSLITTIYLVSTLTTLRLLAISIFLIVIFILIVCCVFWITEDAGEKNKYFSKYFSDKRIKYYKTMLALSLFLFVAIPPKSNMYAMLAIKAGENIYQSEIGQKGLELLSLKLDELLPKPKAN
jgi:heme/copper-type cytochrome/quinol oxidase subunit 2